MRRRSRTLTSSPSGSGDPWLASVMTAYAKLMHQWSVLSMMIQFAPPGGWQVYLECSKGIPELLVSPGLPLSPPIGDATGTYSGGLGSATYIGNSSWTGNVSNDLAQFAGAEPSPSAPRTPIADTKGRSITSKRATCPSVPRRSAQ